MTLAKTGYTANTSKKYLVNSGVIYKNLVYTTETGWSGTILGATAEGTTLKIELNYRQIEIDGPKVNTMGEKVLESANASLETNVKELTAEILRQSLNGTIADVEIGEAPTGYKVVKSKMKVEATDFLTNIAYVGTLTGTNEPIIIILDNAFVTSGLETEHKENSEAVVTLVFEAHATAEQVNAEELPWTIYYPGEPA